MSVKGLECDRTLVYWLQWLQWLRVVSAWLCVMCRDWLCRILVTSSHRVTHSSYTRGEELAAIYSLVWRGIKSISIVTGNSSGEIKSWVNVDASLLPRSLHPGPQARPMKMIVWIFKYSPPHLVPTLNSPDICQPLQIELEFTQLEAVMTSPINTSQKIRTCAHAYPN